jgi:sulfite dehydrogenase
MPNATYHRRSFLKTAALGAATLSTFACNPRPLGRFEGAQQLGSSGDWSSSPDMRPLARFAEKVPLILLTDRPPQLETPLHYFREDLTPSDAYFVRWHLAGIPISVDLASWRLAVSGNVDRPLDLSLNDLKRKFDPVSLIALNQCSGNSRGLFAPRVAGGQWRNGAMGNSRWVGVRLKDILDRAGVKAKTVEVGLRGLDVPPLSATPVFEKALKIDHARDGEVMVAYEMNGAPLPMLNGFPVRLVVPGWYATYWVKSLSFITVRDTPLRNFWMEKAYRIPNNAGANEEWNHPTEDTVPINRFAVHSLFVSPEPGQAVTLGRNCQVQGLAMDYGSGIDRVELSTDGGRSWNPVALDRELGKYSWRRWRANWHPAVAGTYTLMVRAINKDGVHQLDRHWNHGGYQRSAIEHMDVKVA